MSEKELNKYRLTSLDEPTDEMLAQIMREAAEGARKENEEIEAQYLAQMKAEYNVARIKWGV